MKDASTLRKLGRPEPRSKYHMRGWVECSLDQTDEGAAGNNVLTGRSVYKAECDDRRY